MKIAQVIPYDFSRPGGVKSHIENLAIYLKKMGHEVKIIAPNVNGHLIDNPDVKLIGKGRNTDFWGGTKIDINMAKGDEIKELKAYLKKEQFDILHFHNGWTPFMTYQVRYFSNAKNVGTFHDTPTDTFFGQKIVGGILMPLASGVVTLVADELISVSKSQAKYVTRFFTKKPAIIPNGINPEQFNTSFDPWAEYQDDKFNLLYLGRFEGRKGLFYALESFKQLKPKYPNLRLLIAGDGDQKQDALDFVSNNHLEDVVFLGFVDEDKKASLIRTAHIMLATAIFGESFGIVLLEAMACGTPMVGFGNSGYLNVINGKWTEYFPEPRDGQSLTDKIEKLYNNPDIREEMIDWGIEEAKKYEWAKITEQVETVYQKALAK